MQRRDISAPSTSATDATPEGKNNGVPRFGGPRWLAGVSGTVALLIFIWQRNYNFLGEFYDYSIVSAGAGWLRDGLKPYRDFTTPLQSLTLYVGCVAEGLFGPRYLSLAYANLLLGLGFFFGMLRLLRGRVPDGLRLLSAVALCVATFFQHGIVWYNSLAMGLTCLIVTTAAVAFRRERLRVADVAVLSGLLLLSSITKLNFHLVGLGVTGLMGLAHAWTRREQLVRLGCVAAVLIGVGTFLGPALEMLLNGCGPAVWFENVVRTPAGRVGMLGILAHPRLYFGELANGVYPDNWSAGVYLKAALVYAVVAYFIVARGELKPAAAADPAGRPERWRMIAWLPLFFALSLLLTATNWETQMLTSALVLAGLLATTVWSAPRLAAWRLVACHAGIFLLAAFFLIAGSASTIRHSRLRFNETGTVGYHEAKTINPALEGYFSGVRLTDRAWRRLVEIDRVVQAENLLRQPGKIYWGPGLEILNRAYGGELRGRLPLWYDYGVTARDADAVRIIAELKKADYEWIFSAWSFEMPAAVRDYIKQNFRRIGDGEVEVYRRVR